METQKSYYITTEKMSVGYDGKPLIEEVEIMLRKGEILTLLGPNGAGKSTILKSIARQLSLIAGTVRLDGEDMKSLTGAELSKKMAVVMTKRLRGELMTCEDVVATGRYPYTGRFGVLRAEDHAAVQNAMELVQVAEIGDSLFDRISDGQRQRVMLARAICQEPEILILDEPTSYLDVRHKLEFLSILQKLCRERQLTVILSLHELELAEKICGQPFASVTKDGSAASERNYLLIQPPKISGKDQQYYGQESIVSVAAQMLPQLMEQRESFLAFAKSRKNVEVVLKETRDRLDAADFLTTVTSDQISGYRGGYTPIERKTIEQQMIRGDLLGLVSTNALELGIDIGSIGVTVLIGYPGTRSSFWQQTGRAGRSKKSCTNYLILDHLPRDQYIGLEPGWLFDESSEHAVIDPDNLLIELAHIRAAAAELPLSLDDIARFPDLGETIPVLMKMQEVRSQNGRFAWAGGEYPAGDFSMRNIDKNKYTLLNQETGKTITEMDESQAFREIHEGAVYIHDGESYRVVKMDLESKVAYAIPFNGNYYTVAGGETNIHVIHSQKEQQWNRIRVQFGDVNVADYIYMYKKLQFHNHQNLGYEELRTPLTKDYDTEGTWMHLPENLVRAYRGLLQADDTGRLTRNNHFQGLCFALKNAAQMVTMTEQEDIHVITSTNALELSGETASDVSIYFYDGYVGGLGSVSYTHLTLPTKLEV